MPLGEETVTPCARPSSRRIAAPSDLCDNVLIQSDSKQVQWADWFAANGLVAPPPNGSRFDRSFLAIAAAVAGLGVALESTASRSANSPPADSSCRWSGKATAIRYVGHDLVFPRYVRQRHPLRAFATWLPSGTPGLKVRIPARRESELGTPCGIPIIRMTFESSPVCGGNVALASSDIR